MTGRGAPGPIVLSAHLSLLFANRPNSARPAAAQALGFGTVESWWPGNENQAGDWATAVARTGLQVALLNAPAGDLRGGDRGFLNVPAHSRAVLDDLERALVLADRVGASRLNVLTGIALPGVSLAAQLELVCERLATFAGRAADHGIRILIEPINTLDVPGYLVPDAPAAVALIEQVDADGMGLLYDVYHAARAGRDPVCDILTFAPYIDHVQFADCPGRGPVGTGELDLIAVLAALQSVGYRGALGMEHHPPADVGGWLRDLQRIQAVRML
jgi:hydroxypyruvate isomerase